MTEESDLGTLKVLVEHHYGISIAQMESLGGELDTNAYVRDDRGREFTIKRSLCLDPANVRWQYAILDHLAERLNGIDVPTLERTQSGELDVVVSHPDGWLVVRLARWVPGVIMGGLSNPPNDLLRQWGHLAAETVLALSDFPPGQVPGTHHWDVRRSIGVIEECVQFVDDEERKNAVLQIVDWGAEAIPWLQNQPSQVVHQDLNDFNVLVDDRARRITGLLDVGDAILAPRIAELVVACAYAMLRQSDPSHAFDQVVVGYTQVLSLDDSDIKDVAKLAGLRLCVNATTWTMRDHVTGTEYGQRRMAATWPAIEALAGKVSAAGDFGNY